MEHIAISRIIIGDARQRQELGDLTSLAASIRQNGIHNPILVDDENVLIAGERRLTAATMAGLSTVPIIRKSEITPDHAYLIELEENVHRKDLEWHEKTFAIYTYHQMKKEADPEWTQEHTADCLGVVTSQINAECIIQEEINRDPSLLECATRGEALNTARRKRDRRNAAAQDSFAGTEPEIELDIEALDVRPEDTVENIEELVAPKFTEADLVLPPKSSPPAASILDIQHEIETAEAPIFNASFLDWEPPKGFRPNLIHCDFPYGINLQDSDSIGDGGTTSYADGFEIYEALIDRLETVDYFAQSCHMIFWFAMKHYDYTKARLRGMGWTVLDEPLIWHKSDNVGILSDAQRRPRHIYETALFCTKGDLKIVTATGDCVSLPKGRVKDLVHRSEKPVPMLRHFFKLVVDENTTLFDPTCGSGNAIIAAEEAGAKLAIGLEIDEAIHADAVRHYQETL